MNILSQKTLLLILFLAALSFFGGWLFFRGQNETVEEMNQSGIERSSPVLSENVERKEVMSDESEMIDEKRGEEKLGGLFRRVDTIGWSLYEDPEFSFKYPSSYSIRKIRDGLLVFGTEERVSSSFLPRSSSIVEKGFSLSIERTLLGDDGSGKSDVLLLREWSGGSRSIGRFCV
ncbi:MAG: hypothetical protein IPL87_02880 [Candidatus Moraniibacteriota bacterium]|nr:MAG: hypothetical protein IPL87_02880 [Candidatus Moranbacteria bacterium]